MYYNLILIGILYQDTGGWALFFTYGVPTGILLVILIFCYFQLWPFVKRRIEAADEKREEQVSALIEIVKQNAIFNERIMNSLNDMNKGIEELRTRQRQRGA